MSEISQDKQSLQKLANSLAKRALQGDINAGNELSTLLRTNSYVRSLWERAKKKAERESAKNSKDKKRKGERARGSVMHGLMEKISSRPWGKTK